MATDIRFYIIREDGTLYGRQGWGSTPAWAFASYGAAAQQRDKIHDGVVRMDTYHYPARF